MAIHQPTPAAKSLSSTYPPIPADVISKHVKKSYAYHLEHAMDLSFLSSIVVAPAAFGLMGYCLWAEQWLWAGLALIVALVSSVVLYGRYIAPWQLRIAFLHLDGRVPRLNHAPSATTSHPKKIIAPQTAQPAKLKVVFFSDLHLARIKKRAWVQRVVEVTNRHKPDVVLIGGDFVGVLGDNTFEDLLAPFKNLHAPRGIYAILGNHDYGLPGTNHAQEIERALHSVGTRLLRNEALNLDERVQLLAVDELWGDYDDIDKSFAAANAKRQTQTKRIFLGHNPDLMLKIKPEQRADLFIFGHTHHGQIYLPFWPSLAVPIHSDFYRGTFDTPNGVVYVSSGAGDANSPIRILTWPEIVVFEI
jgi:uncharacterized protein